MKDDRGYKNKFFDNLHKIDTLFKKHVTKIDLDPETYMAMIEMTIKDNVRLPKDTKAAVVDSGIMGDKYIRLEPGKDSQKLKPYDYLKNTTPYKSLEDNVREFIFLSTKDDVK